MFTINQPHHPSEPDLSCQAHPWDLPGQHLQSTARAPGDMSNNQWAKLRPGVGEDSSNFMMVYES
jgi:hypothetical protein